MREIKFRACKGFEKYDVDNNGNVWSNNYNHTNRRKKLRLYTDRDGYFYVFFVVDNKRYKRMVHRLVIEAFKPQPTKKHQCNHIDGNRQNNFIENLEWVTHQENVIHDWKNGRKPSEKQIENGKRLAKFINQKRWNAL